MYKLFILSGASGAGKSTLLDRIVKSGTCNAAIKFSERKKFNTVDDVTTVENIRSSHLQCDIIYTMYGNKYGFSSENISKQLRKGNVILITNDIATIEKLNFFFPKQVVVIFVVSDINQRLLRDIYMKRHGFPSIKCMESLLAEQLRKAERMIKQDDADKFIQCIDMINDLVDKIVLQEEEYRLRLDSIMHQEKIYSLGLFTYNYTVLNLYSNNKSSIHATKSAFDQLVKIINKETGE